MKVLRPQDIFVLFGLVIYPDDQKWTYDLLAGKLGLSTSQIYRSLQRAETSHLFDTEAREVRRPELLEFLGHGIRYAFPANPGPKKRGVPTCWDAPAVSKSIRFSAEEQFVWPSASGTHRAQSIDPLHSSAIAVAGEDPEVYGLLALTDVLRVGSAREREMARKQLEQIIL